MDRLALDFTVAPIPLEGGPLQYVFLIVRIKSICTSMAPCSMYLIDFIYEDRMKPTLVGTTKECFNSQKLYILT
jgi:hypothetical protein